MPNYLIAYGGTGQHAALAYARLCFLCKDIIDDLDSPGTGRLPFFYVFDKDIGIGDREQNTAGSLLFNYAKRLLKNVDVNAVNPIPKIDAGENAQTLRDLLKKSPGIGQILFTDTQLDVEVVHGNFGQPAVGAVGLYLKQFDTVKKDTRDVNNDSAFSNLTAAIQNTGGQKIAHVGSAIGGTGSGVMPAAVSYFASLHTQNKHFTLPILEWFKLVGEGNNEQDATDRNNLIRQNRSSGIHFYLRNLQQISSALPIGYSGVRLESNNCKRLWEGDYNQTVKESAIHLAAALAIWEFYFDGQVFQNGMYSYVTDDDVHISHISKLGNYTLGSVLSANLTLIEETKHVCNLLKNPPPATHVLFPYLKEKLSVPALRQFSKTEWSSIADKIEAIVKSKVDAVEWIKSLDYVDNTIKTAQTSASFRGIKSFAQLFPKEVQHKEVSDAIYRHLLARAKSRLQQFIDNPEDKTLTSGSRLLPSYALQGTNPIPALKGTLAPITDANHIKRLYRTGEIAPESIPSLFGVIHVINLEIEERIARIDNPTRDAQEAEDTLMQTNTQRRRDLFERYLLLFKGLVAGKVIPQKKLLWETKEKKSLGWVIGHLNSEHMRYAELLSPDIYYLIFKPDEGQEVIMGATIPTIFLFPSMSVKDEIWDKLDGSVGFIGNDVLSALAEWCDLIKQRDGLDDHKRPGWFRVLWREFGNFAGMPRHREILGSKDEFPIFWDTKLINIPMFRLKLKAEV